MTKGNKNIDEVIKIVGKKVKHVKYYFLKEIGPNFV